MLISSSILFVSRLSLRSIAFRSFWRCPLGYFPPRRFQSAIAYARSNPGKITLGTGTKGVGPNMAAELFKMMTGVDLVIVAYRAEHRMLTDWIGGQFQVGSLADPWKYRRAGKLRALAMAGAGRRGMVTASNNWRVCARIRGQLGWCGIVAPRTRRAKLLTNLTARSIESSHPTSKARLADDWYDDASGARRQVQRAHC